jgi:hypothetical protein
MKRRRVEFPADAVTTEGPPPSSEAAAAAAAAAAVGPPPVMAVASPMVAVEPTQSMVGGPETPVDGHPNHVSPPWRVKEEM